METEPDPSSPELPGLRVTVDRVVYHQDAALPPDRPHAFIYFLTLHNESPRTVTFIARKWVVRQPDGQHFIVEGDGIVGHTPTLAPGETFSYNSFHLLSRSATARGSFHGVDADGNHISVAIPVFRMDVPGEPSVG